MSDYNKANLLKYKIKWEYIKISSDFKQLVYKAKPGLPCFRGSFSQNYLIFIFKHSAQSLNFGYL